MISSMARVTNLQIVSLQVYMIVFEVLLTMRVAVYFYESKVQGNDGL